MLDIFLNELSTRMVPVVVTLILALISKYVVPVFVAKRKEIEQRIGADKAKDIEDMAYKIWLQVDEHFRITQFVGDTIAAKQSMFDKLLLEKIPGLTQKQIEDLRQSIAGEVNKGREKIVAANAVSIDPQQLQQLQEKAQKFDQLQSTLNPANDQSTQVNQ